MAIVNLKFRFESNIRNLSNRISNISKQINNQVSRTILLAKQYPVHEARHL